MLSTLTICRAAATLFNDGFFARPDAPEHFQLLIRMHGVHLSVFPEAEYGGFASQRQLARGRITSISQPTSPSSLNSRAISSPLWLKLNHSGVSGANAGLPCSP